MKKLCIFLLITVSSVFSNSYTAYSLLTGENSFTFSPSFHSSKVGQVRSTGSSVSLSYGVIDELDFQYELGSDWSEGAYKPYWSSMIRGAFYRGNIIAFEFDAASSSLQYHLNLQGYHYDLVVNAVISAEYEDFEKVSTWGIFSIARKFGIESSIFCEVVPGYYSGSGCPINGWDRTEGVGLDVVPGICFLVRDVSFSAAVPVYDVLSTPTATLGLKATFLLVR